MGSLQDFTQILCSGTISFPCGDTLCSGTILFPCGAFHDTKVVGGGLQLPYRYQIFRERARLVPCCYWRDSSEDTTDLEQDEPSKTISATPDVFEFINVNAPSGVLPKIEVTYVPSGNTEAITQEIDDPDLQVVGGWDHETLPSFIVVPRTLETIKINGATSIPTKCQKAGASNWHQGLDGTPPCNGAKTECPFYTGPKFKYIQDEHTAPGQPVKAHIVQELRHYIQDWLKFSSPQDQWEKSFEEPYIWAWDKEQQPVRIEGGQDEDFVSIPVHMILDRIYWNIEEGDAVVNKFPSEESGTEVEGEQGEPQNSDRRTPPKFPTLISNLRAVSKPPIEIKFPIRAKSVEDSQTENPFVYEGFEKGSNLIYMSGLAFPVLNLYVINRNYFSEFPDLKTTEVSDEDLSAIIKNIIVKAITAGNLEGYRYTTSNQSRFWHIPDGIELKPNAINELYVLGNIEGEWSYDYLTVNYIFHHAEIVQRGIKTSLEGPATQGLLTRISQIHPSDDFTFDVFNFSGNAIPSNAYHYYVLDRSLSRFIRGLDTPTDKRYWKVVRDKSSIEGNGIEGSLVWRRLDNCNQYLVEIKNPILPAALPVGLDRSWEPKNIKFTVEQEPGTSSHGTQQNTVVEMKVVDDYGRSLSGFPLPINFIIVEPKTNQDLRLPTLESMMTMDVEIYRAVATSEEGEDVLQELRDENFNDSNSYSAGGAPMFSVTDETELETSPHSLTISSDLITVEDPSKLDMSYMIEFTSNITGRVVGRKWIYGVGEISNTWARDIDIYYSWRATQSFKKILPDYNKAISSLFSGQETGRDVFGPEWYQYALDATYTTYKPKCGDHDVSFGKPGPMFAPYEDCDYPYTHLNNLGLIVDARISYADPIDEKYRGPDFQEPTIYKHNVFGTLFPKCWFEYSTGTFTRGVARWNGLARLRGPISLTANPLKYLKYQALDFTFPKFGNIGREQIRIFRTMHFREFVYTPEGSGEPKVGLGWMPSFPYVGSNSLFQSNSPRIVIEQSLRNTPLASFITVDINNYASVKNLLDLATSGIEPMNIGTQNTETFFFERKKFDDVYRVKKVRTKDGQGTRWPEIGFYFNFRSDKVVWAFPEQELELARDYTQFNSDILSSSDFLSGVHMKNAKGPNASETIQDKYNRNVFQGLKEGQYSIKIKDAIYDEEGNTLEYASIFIDESLKLYFDRFTGEIKDTKNPTDPLPLLHTVDTPGELQTYITSGSINTEIFPYFEHVNATLENSAPTLITDLDDFDNTGNLYVDLSKLYIYAKEGLEGALDDEDVEWGGFYPSIKVETLTPKYMPKKELIFNDEDGEFTGINPSITFTAYPSSDPEERSALSNTPLQNGTQYVDFFSYTEGPSPDEFEWMPYLNNDLSISGNPMPDPREGFIGPITIECTFKNPIEISHLELSYEIFALFDNNPLPTPPPQAIPPKYDPAITIELIDPSNTDALLLVQKDNLQLVKYKQNTFSRNFKFSFSDDGEDVSPIEQPWVTKKLRISIGIREYNTGFRLSKCFLKCLKLNDEIEEEITSIEPKYMLSTGLYPNSDSDERKWAQDSNHLTGTVPSIDISDPLEYNGIAEFWRPLNTDKEVTYTEGKLRRHFAGKYLSWDTDSSNPDVSFLDATVQQSEARQEKLIQEQIVDTLLSKLPQVRVENTNYFCSPFDTKKLEDIVNQGGTTVDIRSLIGAYQIQFDVETFDSTALVGVVVGKQAPGWQDAGFYSCLSPKTHTAACTNLGRRMSMIAYAGDHGVCKGGSGGDNPGILASVLDLFAINRPGNILGVDPLSPSFQQENDPNSLTEIAKANADKEQILSRTEEYRQKKKRYNP